VLLTLHAKLNKWLQLGGHVDGENEVQNAARREAQEESGRDELQFFPYEALCSELALDHPLPFDIDIHLIPARQDEPSHFHYDLRFLCQLDPALPLVISEESHDLRWLSVSDAQNLTDERSMQRQFLKLQALRERLLTR
jgi:8-oxo-dGTP pyrophosphatase MutT (NUDIX family)